MTQLRDWSSGRPSPRHTQSYPAAVRGSTVPFSREQRPAARVRAERRLNHSVPGLPGAGSVPEVWARTEPHSPTQAPANGRSCTRSSLPSKRLPHSAPPATLLGPAARPEGREERAGLAQSIPEGSAPHPSPARPCCRRQGAAIPPRCGRPGPAPL